MAELHEREMDVLYGIAEGKRIPELAADLFLSTHTVRTYRRRLYRDLGARNAPHAVAIAYRRGILRIPERSDGCRYCGHRAEEHAGSIGGGDMACTRCPLGICPDPRRGSGRERSPELNRGGYPACNAKRGDPS